MNVSESALSSSPFISLLLLNQWRGLGRTISHGRQWVTYVCDIKEGCWFPIAYFNNRVSNIRLPQHGFALQFQLGIKRKLSQKQCRINSFSSPTHRSTNFMCISLFLVFNFSVMFLSQAMLLLLFRLLEPIATSSAHKAPEEVFLHSALELFNIFPNGNQHQTIYIYKIIYMWVYMHTFVTMYSSLILHIDCNA